MQRVPSLRLNKLERTLEHAREKLRWAVSLHSHHQIRTASDGTRYKNKQILALLKEYQLHEKAKLLD